MSEHEVRIPSPDGDIRAFVFTPGGAGPWPGVIFYMDAPAIRPALFAMCERLAGHGYYVLLPDMFWRGGAYEPIDIAKVMQSDELRRETFGRLMATTSSDRAMQDTAAMLDFLARDTRVAGTRIGVTGYCMGGAFALRAAGHFPDRVAAAASFHGARLATDAPDSPHLLAPAMRAKVLVAGADADDGFPPEQADRLRAALDAAGVDNVVTIYAGARHGYAPPDMPAYDREASERHWHELFALFDGVLRSPELQRRGN